MDKIHSFIAALRKKNHLQLSLILILLIAIPATLYLVRNTQIFKGRAHDVNISHIDFPGLSGTPPTTTSQTVTLKLTYGTGTAPSPTPTPPPAAPIPSPLPCTTNNCITGLVLLWNDSSSNGQLELAELSPFGAGALGMLMTLLGPLFPTGPPTLQTDQQGRFILSSVTVPDPANNKLRLLIYASKRAVGGSFSQAGRTADNVIPVQQNPVGTLDQYPANSFVVWNNSSTTSTTGYIFSPEFRLTSAVTINVVFAGGATTSGSGYGAAGSRATPTPTPRSGSSYTYPTPGYPTPAISGATCGTASYISCGSTICCSPKVCTNGACVNPPAPTPTPAPTATPRCKPAGSACNGYIGSAGECCTYNGCSPCGGSPNGCTSTGYKCR